MTTQPKTINPKQESLLIQRNAYTKTFIFTSLQKTSGVYFTHSL